MEKLRKVFYAFSGAVTVVLSGLMFNFASISLAHCACYDAAGPGVDWSGCRKRNLVLSESNFTSAIMNGVDLSASDMRQVKLDNAQMAKSMLRRASFSSSTMENANLAKVEASRTDFSRAIMNGVNFEKASMFRANFADTKLVGSNFNKSEFSRANFMNADLSRASMQFANLSRANFQNANLSDLDLKTSWTYLSNFVGVDLSSVKNVSQQQLDIACGSSETKLPLGLTRPSHWPCNQNE